MTMAGSKTEKLDGEELLRQYYASGDPLLKEKAVKEFLPLVYYVVNRVTLPATDAITREDLEQSAIHGLLEAIDRFDEDRNVKFKTFAYKRIYGAVIDAIRQVRILSRTKLEQLMAVQKITEALASLLATASATVSKTGTPPASCPPLPGVTPATTWVPYACICWV